MTPPLPEWAGKGDRLDPTPPRERLSYPSQQHIQSLDPQGSPSLAGLSAPSAASWSLGKLYHLRFSQPSGRTQGAGWFPGGARLGHFPKLGSTLRPHPGRHRLSRASARRLGLSVCARASRQRRSSPCPLCSRTVSSLCGLARSQAGPRPLRCPLQALRCKPLIGDTSTSTRTP